MASNSERNAITHSPQDPQERLKFYRLDRFVKAMPSPPPERRDMHFDPGREDARQYYVRVPVESLDDAKLWMGFPNDHIDHRRHWQHLRPVAAPPFPEKGGRDALRQVPREVIADAEHNVLFGYVDEGLLREPFWAAIVEALRDRLRDLQILVIGDLVVQDGETVTISNTPTAYFNRVTVYGSGSIVLEGNTKIIADVIEHLDAPSTGRAGTRLPHP